MNQTDYDFKVGDLVVTVYGDIGNITDICDCDECKKRGFYEPRWVDRNGEEHYITNYAYLCRFMDEYYQIGKYHFNNRFSKEYVTREVKKREDELAVWKKRLAVIEMFEEDG